MAYEVSQLAAVARVLADPTLLAVPASAPNRIASFPDVPTFKELGYGDVEFYIWAGLFAHKRCPHRS